MQLTKLFHKDASSVRSVSELMDDVCKNGGHAIANWSRGEGVPYSELLYDVAKKLKVSGLREWSEVTHEGLTIAEMDQRWSLGQVDQANAARWKAELKKYVVATERGILGTFMADAYARMTPQQKAEIDKKLEQLYGQDSTKGLKHLSASAAILAIAHGGGFATYMLMSSVISTLSLGAAGFSVYTAASTLLSFIIGPVGWAALGVAAVYKLGGPNQQRSVQAVIAIAIVRNGLEAGPN
jgi:uncharacterized protein YaaW (UPF0174 family)